MPKNTKNVLLKKLLRLGLPIMAGNFLHSLYNLIDTFFLGKVGKEALAAPSIALPIIVFFIVFGMGFSVAGTTLIGQSKGKKDHDKADFYLGQMTFIILTVSVFISIIGFLSAPGLLKLISVPEDSYTYTLTYIRIVFTGIPFMFLSFLFQSALRGVGNSVTPLLVQSITVSLNIALDPLLIFGIGFFPRMEVAGAAYATVFARCTASVISIIMLCRGKKGIRLRLRHLKPDGKALRLYLRIGLPASLGQAVSALGFTVLQGVVNTFGSSVIAVFGIGNRVVNLFNMPAVGLSQAAAVLVAHNLGKKDHAQAKHVATLALRSILVFIIPCVVYTTIWGKNLIRLFINDTEVIEIGAQFFRIFSPSVAFFTIFSVITGIFQGGGDTKPVMILNAARLWGLRVPLAWLLSTVLGKGPVGIWIAMIISNIAISIAGYIIYKTNRWMYFLNPDEI